VDVASGRIGSVEALLRWNDPDRGIREPAEFLAVLESSGMIVPVGEWVLERAAMDCRRWQSSGLPPLRVAVNVSALQIRRRNFVEAVLKQVNGWPGEGFGIDLEITETGLLQDLEATSRKLRELRRAGLRIAIDDFGTGYSSLALLSKLPVDLLKIDRSFIRGLPSDRASLTLVSSIIGLASAFDLTAVAEGVETAAQLSLLTRFGCHQTQGYLHSRPLPTGDLEKLLAQRR
jgi:EAL domain-containing protein (putative c-di-GMP-specific phosphodiesterase class I)